MPEGEWYIYRGENELELMSTLSDVNDVGEDTDEELEDYIGVIYIGVDTPKKSWIRQRKSFCGWKIQRVELNTMPDATQSGEITLRKVVNGKVVTDDED